MIEKSIGVNWKPRNLMRWWWLEETIGREAGMWSKGGIKRGAQRGISLWELALWRNMEHSTRRCFG